MENTLEWNVKATFSVDVALKPKMIIVLFDQQFKIQI